MKAYRFSTRLILFWLLAALVSCGGSRESAWKQVEQAAEKDDPKRMMELLAGIERASYAEGAWGEGTRALATRIALEARVEGPEASVKKVEAAIPTAPEQAKPVLRALSAHWLSGYFNQNRWRFMRRSTTEGPIGDDIASWDLARILTEVDARMQRSLADAEALKKMPAADFAGMLSEGSLGDAPRPTMYDFVANTALAFYSEEAVAASRPTDSFEVAADSPAFGTAEEFMAWKPQTGDGTSPKARALKILQDLLTFHRADADRSAYLTADFERLRWANKAAAEEGKAARFEHALRRFIQENAAQPASAWARLDLAVILQGRNEMKEAHAVFSAGVAAFKDHPFGKLCADGVAELEHPGLSLSTRSHWTPAGEGIQIEHRNLKKVHFRIYQVAFTPGKATLEQDPRPKLAKEKPLRAWESPLPDDGDYRVRTTKLPAPMDLPPGYYVLVASADDGFALKNNVVEVAGVHVTSLALTTRNRPGGGVEGAVVDAVSGAPQAGVAVGVWTERNILPGARKLSAKTGEDGHFEIKGKIEGNFLAVAERGEERAVSREWTFGSDLEKPEVEQTVVFFTDRAIYRPGQTIHFKGIWCQTDPARGKYSTLAERAGTVVLSDPNNKEIAKLAVKTNARGSFSGSFTAPEGSVLGNCSLGMEGDTSGYSRIRVEEYKRPKFFAEIDAPADPAALGQAVKVKVRAEAYTGAPVDGAKVAWRVTRMTRLPDWIGWCWWCPPVDESAEEIAHGTLETDATGAATVEFKAKPDSSVRQDLEPVFEFMVTVDITDHSGETRSGSRQVRVADTALKADLDADEWLEAGKPAELRVLTASHDGEGRGAKGTLKIHRLKEPAICPRSDPPETAKQNYGRELPPDPADPDRWETGEVVAELPVETDKEGKAALKHTLAAGCYRLIFETKDANGRVIRAIRRIQVLAPQSDDFPTMRPFFVAAPAWSVEPGKEAVVAWGSGHEKARACIEWRAGGRLLKREWSQPGRTQQLFRLAIGEQHRGGISVMVWQVAMNRLSATERLLEVPWVNKQFKLRWEHLVSKMQPGAQETWTAVIEGPGGEAAAAEMVAALYDASLDAFAPHSFQSLERYLREESRGESRTWELGSAAVDFETRASFESPDRFYLGQPFRGFREELEIFGRLYGGYGVGRGGGNGFGANSLFLGGGTIGDTTRSNEDFISPASGVNLPGIPAESATNVTNIATAGLRSGDGAINRNNIDAVLSNPNRTAQVGFAGGNMPDMSKVAARANLQETAFFMPDLVSDAEGKVRMTFTMPEALTKWRFLGLAHDKEMRSGLLEGETVTAKDLMVQPNPPRFLREGDELAFTVKITNTGEQPQSGTARFSLMDAATEADKTAALGVTEPEQKFEVPPKESRTLKWRVVVPDGSGFLRYKAVASTGALSDGEEGWLPVIPRRILVTESLSLPMRDAGKKSFTFDKLAQSGASNTLENRFLHVQVVSQPAWYAVMALPYLMEFPHECAEQTFNRYYANGLARHIADSDPKMRRIFDQWKVGEKALDSPLTKNQDLKGILLDETPWLAEAKDESAARRRVGLLFDGNHMEREQEKAMEKLAGMQLGNGLWPWLPGGRGDEYITLYVTTGFARLRALGVDTDITPALRALNALDADLTKQYEVLRKEKHLDKENLDSQVALYLYTRTFFLKDKALKGQDKVAFDYFAGQARKHWAKLGSRMCRAHVALALKRLGDQELPAEITRSLKSHAVTDEELGMYWKDSQGEGWWWWQAPVETQAMMIEAFREIDHDEKAVEDCQVWLLKQKQVQDWKTTKATADAVYSLLLGGKNLLASDALLKVSLGGQEVKPEKVEAGTGFYESRFVEAAVKPELGKIEVEKTDKGVSWASVHWQYLEDMAKVTPHDGTPLKLEKSLFIRRNTDKGPVIEPVKGVVKVGDELVTRVVLKNDRAMEYVHLKDLRGSGTEPVNVLSGYRWQDGFGYYEVTRDTASHFFIDRLPPGTHVFESSVRVQHGGKYQTGVAEIRCMYAPEFNAHSGSVEIVVE